MQPGNVNNLEECLGEWFLKMKGSKAVLTDDILIKQAKRIGRSLVLPPTLIIQQPGF